jgi:DNA-binding transcriptional ArsR family regulator
VEASLPQQQEAAERILDALGHQTRREILQLLRQQPMAVGAIAAHFPVSRPAISKHLRVLQEAGLVAYRAEGVSNIFYLQPAQFQLLRHYLEVFWTEALTSFQQAAIAQAQAEEGDCLYA